MNRWETMFHFWSYQACTSIFQVLCELLTWNVWKHIPDSAFLPDCFIFIFGAWGRGGVYVWVVVIFLSHNTLGMLHTLPRWKWTRCIKFSSPWLLAAGDFSILLFLKYRGHPSILPPQWLCSSSINPFPAELLQKKKFIQHQQGEDKGKIKGEWINT